MTEAVSQVSLCVCNFVAWETSLLLDSSALPRCARNLEVALRCLLVVDCNALAVLLLNRL